MKTWVWVALACCVLALVIAFAYFYLEIGKINRLFYDADSLYPMLRALQDVPLSDLKAEVLKLDTWIDWPERNLYEPGTKWDVFPLYGFGQWVHPFCAQCPLLYQFLSGLKGLRLATLSRMNPGAKLAPHQGWGAHSNGVLRCHYGIVVPGHKQCYVNVEDSISQHQETQYHEEGKWMVFDDAKTHYAANMSNEDRIVLIVDLDRPRHVKKGTSVVTDTSELKAFIAFLQSIFP